MQLQTTAGLLNMNQQIRLPDPPGVSAHMNNAGVVSVLEFMIKLSADI